MAGFEGESLDAVMDPSGALIWQSVGKPAEASPLAGVDAAPADELAVLLKRDAPGIRVQRINELAAWYAWSTERGGEALLLADDGTWFRAPSAVPPGRHRSDFASGRRSQAR